MKISITLELENGSEARIHFDRDSGKGAHVRCSPSSLTSAFRMSVGWASVGGNLRSPWTE